MDRQARNAEIIRQYLSGKKQLDIAAELGLSKTVVNAVVMGYKESQESEEIESMLRYNDYLRFMAQSMLPGDRLMICIDGMNKEVVVLQASRHTVLCKDDHGMKQSLKYTDIAIWNGVAIKE